MTNWERCTSLDRLLVLCEDHRDRLEAMPSGRALLDQLSESVRLARAHFMTSSASRSSRARSGRNATRRAAQYFFIRALIAVRAAADIDLRVRPKRLPAAVALLAALPSSGNAFRIA